MMRLVATLLLINRELKGCQNLFRTTNVPAAKRQKESVFCLLYILGIISPKSKSKNVRRTVKERNSKTRETPKSTHLRIAKFSIVTIATLTRLLLINMVARRRSLSANNSLMLESARCFSSLISSISLGVKLKNAISLAETKPEHMSNTRARTNAIIAPVSGYVKTTVCRDKLSNIVVIYLFISSRKN